MVLQGQHLMVGYNPAACTGDAEYLGMTNTRPPTAKSQVLSAKQIGAWTDEAHEAWMSQSGKVHDLRRVSWQTLLDVKLLWVAKSP